MPATAKRRVSTSHPILVKQKRDSKPVFERLRKDLTMSAKDFARITGYSERSILGWEAGTPVLPPAKRRLTEIQRLFSSLKELVDAESLPNWFQAPNDAFDGLKPIEVVERGEMDRLWQMIYFLESGVAT